MNTDLFEAAETAEAEHEPVRPGVRHAAHFHRERNKITLEAVPTILSILAGIYIFLGLSHIEFVREPYNLIIAPITFGIGLAAGLAALVSRRKVISEEAAHTLLFAAASAVLFNSAMHFYLVQEIFQATNFALILMAWGLMVLSYSWFVSFYCLVALTWIVLLNLYPYDSGLSVHYTFMMICAAGIGFLGFSIRRRAFDKMIGLRLKDAERQASLSEALERALAADETRERSLAKETFIARIGRDMRTPLSAIAGLCEAIQSGGTGRDKNLKVQEYVEDIRGASLHLTSILDGLRDLMLMEKGDLPMSLSSFHVETTLHSCLALFARRAEEKAITLASDIDPALIYLTTDETRLRQAMVALLANAVEFTPDRGEVHVRAMIEPDNRTLIEIADTGIGMSGDEIEQATRPYWHAAADELERDLQNKGFGLAITAQLVRLLGGTFELTSITGHGTTARICLPASCRTTTTPIAGFSGTYG